MSSTAMIMMIVFALLTLLVTMVLEGMVTTALNERDYVKARNYTIYSLITAVLGFLIVIGIFIVHLWLEDSHKKRILGEKVKGEMLKHKVRQVSAEKAAVVGMPPCDPCPDPTLGGTMHATISLEQPVEIPSRAAQVARQASAQRAASVSAQHAALQAKLAPILPGLSTL